MPQKSQIQLCIQGCASAQALTGTQGRDGQDVPTSRAKPARTSVQGQGNEHTGHQRSPWCSQGISSEGTVEKESRKTWQRHNSSMLNSSSQLGQSGMLGLLVPREAFWIACGGRGRGTGNRFMRKQMQGRQPSGAQIQCE